MNKEIALTLLSIVRVEENVKSTDDWRRRVNRIVAEYKGNDGEVYRKSFESYILPNVPQSGTHETLNAVKYQWKE